MRLFLRIPVIIWKKWDVVWNQTQTILRPSFSPFAGEAWEALVTVNGLLRWRALGHFPLVTRKVQGSPFSVSRRVVLFSWSQMKLTRPNGFKQHWFVSLWNWSVHFQSFDTWRVPPRFSTFPDTMALPSPLARKPAPSSAGPCFIPLCTFRS